uniref:Apolipoprotein N-acyltransferase n=1 Tax=candidate division WOR-3 bacterium TaxID=2052148 RepID=A0A7C4GA50_UNCW3
MIMALVAAGLALGLAFAPFPFRFLAFFSIVPLFWIIDRPDCRRPFLWGWLFGSAAAAFHLWWVWFLLVPVETITRILLNLGVVLLFAYLGLYVGLFALLVRRLGIWSAPLVWPILEFLRSRTQIAFPWDLLGSSMTPWVPFIQPAAFGGVFLVSAWVVLVNLLIYRTFSAFARPRPDWRRALGGNIALLILTFAAPLALSALRVKPPSPWFTAAIVQPNVSPLDKGDWNSRNQLLSDLVHLTRTGAARGGRLVIYPETATLVDVVHSTTLGPALQRLADSLDVEILTGTPLYDDWRRTWHNGTVLIQPNADSISQRYYKLRLVPFSEKIPYVDELPLLRKLIGTSDMGNWDRGWFHTVFRARPGRFASLICYEAIFPDLTREFARRGAELFVVVTNDGWFGRLPGAHQHAELAVMRTVETGLPMVRSANNGISFIVDPYGRILKKTRLFVQDVLVGEVPRPAAPTFYVRFGDWFILVCVLIVVVGLATRAVAARRSRTTTDS